MLVSGFMAPSVEKSAPGSGSGRHACQLRVLALGLSLLASGGCASLGYYTQAGWGGLRLAAKGRPIAKLLSSPEVTDSLRRQLETAVEVREFAFSELELPDNGSYRRYADLGRPYAVWNVVAAPEFSLEPLTWCFPVAGCVSYRGYFSRERADKFGARLRRSGFDASVRGAAAYSTLGHLRDPVLSTFVHRPRAELAEMIFHELAHQVVYVKDDTSFNESFATFVAREGVRRYLAARDVGDEMTRFERNVAREDETIALLLSYRKRLSELFLEEIPEARMRREKAKLLRELEGRLFEGSDSTDRRRLNNADLAGVEAYHERVPAFAALLMRSGGDLGTLYACVRDLAELEREERDRLLDGLAAGQVVEK